MPPHIVKAQSAYNDVRIRSLHHTHTCAHAYIHMHYFFSPSHTRTHTHYFRSSGVVSVIADRCSNIKLCLMALLCSYPDQHQAVSQWWVRHAGAWHQDFGLQGGERIGAECGRCLGQMVPADPGFHSGGHCATVTGAQDGCAGTHQVSGIHQCASCTFLVFCLQKDPPPPWETSKSSKNTAQ